MREPGTDRHHEQFVVCLRQQPLGLGQLGSLQLIVDRVTERLLKLPIEQFSRQPQPCRHLACGELGAALLPDQGQSLTNVGILDREHVAAAPHRDARRRHEHHGRRGPAGNHGVFEHACGLLAKPRSIVGHTRDRRRRQFAESVVVGDRHHRHVVGNLEALVATGLEDIEHLDVVHGDHANGPRQACEPSAQRGIAVLAPGLGSTAAQRLRGVGIDRAAGGRRESHGGIAPQRRAGGDGTDADVPQPAIDEMRHGQPHRRLVIGIDARKP